MQHISDPVEKATKDITDRLRANCQHTIEHADRLLHSGELERQYVIADDRGNALHQPAALRPVHGLQQLYLFPFRDAAERCLKALQDANPGNEALASLGVRLASVTTMESIRVARHLLADIDRQSA